MASYSLKLTQLLQYNLLSLIKTLTNEIKSVFMQEFNKIIESIKTLTSRGHSNEKRQEGTAKRRLLKKKEFKDEENPSSATAVREFGQLEGKVWSLEDFLKEI